MPESFEEWLRGGALPRMLRLATAVSTDPDLAQDLVQDVVIKVQARWPSIVRMAHPDAYVRRMLVNEHLSFRRRFARVRLGEVPESVRRGGPPGFDEQYVERQALIADLARLPVRQRTALALRYVEGLDDGAIAAAMGCRPGTVRAHVSRALATLRVDRSTADRSEEVRDAH